MKKAIYFLLLTSLLASCDNDSGIGQFDNLVIDSESNTYKFEQVTFTISLIHSEYGYLNLSQIDSIELYVDSKYWGTFSSEVRDTSFITENTFDDLSYTSQKTKYLVVAPYQIIMNNMDTAGDYVDFLNNRMTLSPGEYLCELRKIKYTKLNKEEVERKIQLFSPFKVSLNEVSSYVGDLTIQID